MPALELEDALQFVIVVVGIAEREALDWRPRDVRSKPVSDLQRVGARSRHDGVALLLQREVDVQVAAAIRERLIRCAGFRLRGVGSSAVRDDLELVVGVQRHLEGLEELAGHEPIV
jgi:hypothetical protein